MLRRMTARDPEDPQPPDRAWTRSAWLAEKIFSGELPAAGSDLARRCDAFFVDQDLVEDHARLLAKRLEAGPDEAPDEHDRRARDLSAYLHRLLSVREMWARERS